LYRDCDLSILQCTQSFTLGFKPEQNETDYLKRRLREEKLKNANLERARREAEERCAAAERERSVYKMLARRWQSRLDTLLNENEDQGNDNDAEQDLLDLADGIRNDDETAVVNNRNRSALSNLRDILQNINSDDEEDYMEEPGDDDDDDMNMDLEEENDVEGDEVDEDDFASAVEEEEDGNEDDVDDISVVMEDVNVDLSMEEVPKLRTVSVSNDDL